MMEVFLAFLANAKVVACVVGALSAFMFVIGNIFCTIESIDDKAILAKLKAAGICALVSGLIACFPSIDDLWKVRIGLIKFNLASPQNVQLAADKIVEIGHKLECKYIGCTEDKK